MQDNLNQDIMLLKLAKVLNKAYAISQEIVGVDHIFISSSGVTIDVKPYLGKDSNLCFIAGEHEWDKDKAICKVNDVLSIEFKISIPPALVPVKEENVPTPDKEDKAA